MSALRARIEAALREGRDRTTAPHATVGGVAKTTDAHATGPIGRQSPAQTVGSDILVGAWEDTRPPTARADSSSMWAGPRHTGGSRQPALAPKPVLAQGLAASRLAGPAGRPTATAGKPTPAGPESASEEQEQKRTNAATKLVDALPAGSIKTAASDRSSRLPSGVARAPREAAIAKCVNLGGKTGEPNDRLRLMLEDLQRLVQICGGSVVTSMALEVRETNKLHKTSDLC